MWTNNVFRRMNLFLKKRFMFFDLSVRKCLYFVRILWYICDVKVKQSRYRPGLAQRFQEVKVPRFHDNGTGWW